MKRIALVLSLAACGAPENTSPIEATGSHSQHAGALEPTAPETRAARLGEILGEKVRAVEAALTTPLSHAGISRLVTRHFAPPLPRVIEPDGSIVFGERFRLREGRPSELETVDGRPVLELWSISSRAFFYELTLVDLTTGEVFQSNWMGSSDRDSQNIHGPVVPPEEARLTGDFDEAQRLALTRAIRENVKTR